MRICLVSQEYPPETGHGGIATQTSLKAGGLAAAGHTVVVISHAPAGVRTERRQGTLTVVRIPGPEVRFPDSTEIGTWIAWSVEVAAEIRRQHEIAPIDLVEVPDWGCEGYLHLVARQPWHAVPTVVQLHGGVAQLRDGLGWPERGSELERVGTQLESTVIRLADGVAASSRTSRDWVVREHGLIPSRVPVLHAGVDTDRFVPPPERPILTPDASPAVVFVGRVTPAKGADVLATAARTLHARWPGLRVRYAGRADPGERTRLEQLASPGGRAAEVGAGPLEFLGHVERDRLPAVLADATVFALPSRFEAGPGFAFLEAMACGLAVVGPAGGAIEDVITDGETGLLVPVDDSDALAEAIGRLLADPALRLRLGAAARQDILERWSTERWIPRIAAFYEQVSGRTAADVEEAAHAGGAASELR